MLSLSIFSSSQRISVALYEKRKLKLFEEKKIQSNKIDSIFLLLRKILGKNTKDLKKIFFSSGPGSFTATRSIKAIAQGLSTVSKAKIITINDFDIYLSNLKNKRTNSVVFFSNFNLFFYQYFRFGNNKYRSCTEYFNGSIDNVKKFINVKKKIQKNKELIITTNPKNNHLIASEFNSEKIIICEPCAKKIAEAVFEGYGKKSQEILYHHTYYE